MIVIREGLCYGHRDAMIIKQIAVKQDFDGFDFGWFLLHKFAQNVLKHVDAHIFAYVIASKIKYFKCTTIEDVSKAKLPFQQDHIHKLKQQKRPKGILLAVVSALTSQGQKITSN